MFSDRQFFRDAVFFVSLLTVALALGGALAHAFELPNKMTLTRDDYFTVQTIYNGWNKFAIVLAVELSGILSLIYLFRQEKAVLWPVIAALVCLIAAQGIFWIWTFPANMATENWTTQPENWIALRRQWEYSHLAGALFQLLVMAALIVAVLRRRRP